MAPDEIVPTPAPPAPRPVEPTVETPSDELRMSIIEHLRELRVRLVRVVIVIAVAALAIIGLANLLTATAVSIGAHLHDVDGLADHRAPGHGDVEWDYVRRGLPKRALRVFEINQSQPPESVAAAIPFLRERGVV